MAKKSNDVSARIEFVADKMVAKMKKCLEKKSVREYCVYPAIEMETGVMLATDGHTLAAHKLQGYRFEPSDGACLGPTVMLPVEVLKMKGRVEVTVQVVDGDVLATAADGKGATASFRTSMAYPRWRTVIPRTTGWPICVEAGLWDAALKEIVPRMKEYPLHQVRLYGEQKSGVLSICWDNPDTDDRGQKDIGVDSMPYTLKVAFAGERLRNAMVFNPTAMRFADTSRGVIFYNDDTLCLVMPVNEYDQEPFGVDRNHLEGFDLEGWIGADLGDVVVDNTKAAKAKATNPEPCTVNHEPSMAERLRAVLLAQVRRAA